MTELRDYQQPSFCNKMSKAGCFLGGIGGVFAPCKVSSFRDPTVRVNKQLTKNHGLFVEEKKTKKKKHDMFL